MLPTAGRSTAGIRGRLTNAACALGKALASKHTPAYAFRPTHMCTIFGSSLHQTALAATLPKPRRPSRPRWLAKACLAERPGAMGCHRGRQATARSEVGDRALSISRCHGLSRLSQAVTAVTAVTRCHERSCPRYAKTIAGGVYSGGMLHQKLSFAILPLPQVPNYNGYKTLYPLHAQCTRPLKATSHVFATYSSRPPRIDSPSDNAWTDGKRFDTSFTFYILTL